jgi:hypothetical protein
MRAAVLLQTLQAVVAALPASAAISGRAEGMAGGLEGVFMVLE